jgi:pyroglutamyl-peptidase
VAAGRLRALLTGFEPFGGEPVNPSELIVTALAAEPAGVAGLQLATEILPVDRLRMPPALARAIARHRPHVVVSVGQATGRPRVDLETLAHNAIDFRGDRDNGGHAASGEALVPGGPERLPSTLPLARLLPALLAQGFPVALSSDAGRHLCNALLYTLLHGSAPVPAAFVHVPLLPEQAARRGKGEPSLPLDVSRACVAALLARLPEALAAPPGAPHAPPRAGA